ncbi:histidine phosphatase family protein [uncultured Roseovarius sp.]|uniref:SixA phosphatase family protein n=1 Tax=uncultured Roseovarius sp. TaxID=293344 RepID=UPI002604370F|nr:histidine phosphatase family protein [uncultured Roseovarius sp.]
MTLRLILMRHAKSSWSDPTQEDHQRPLNGRGQRSATALGAWLRENDYIPDQILSSSSRRTQETGERLNLDAETSYLDALYHAGPDQMQGTLQAATGRCVLMLGHNPGIAYFAHDLVAMPPDHARFQDYPTCATLVADFTVDSWQDVRPRTGQVVDFVIPRELTDG